MRAGAPVPMLTINSVAPTIMRYGSQEQKDFFIPKILAGDINFAIGYTEPDAGTDLASLKTRAVRDGDEYVINGQKVFTSLASDADYIWLAVRTDPNVKKHKGISIIIVPTDTPGFSYKPIDNFGGVNTNITYYEDVRVPAGEPRRWREPGLGADHQPAQPRTGHVVLVGRRRAPAARRAPVGAGDEARRRAARHRPGVGAAQPRVGARAPRVPEARELAGGVGRDQGRPAQPGRRVEHQGVRHRVLHGGVPAPARGTRAASDAAGRLARCRVARPHRIARTRACTSSPSAAARTRCSATSSRSSASTCPARRGSRPGTTGARTVDFSLSEEQQELSGLARRILTDRMTLAHLKERDRSDDWYDRDTWLEFAKANLLGIADPRSARRPRSRPPRPVPRAARGRSRGRPAAGGADARVGRDDDRPLRQRRTTDGALAGGGGRRLAHRRAAGVRLHPRRAGHDRDARRRRLAPRRCQRRRCPQCTSPKP